jgi:hypothetical protein
MAIIRFLYDLLKLLFFGLLGLAIGMAIGGGAATIGALIK